MPLRSDTFDLPRLRLSSGQGRRLDLHVHVEPFRFAEQEYEVEPELVAVRLDVSRTTGNGYALRLRFAARLDGPCFRCLEPARPEYAVDAREVNVPGSGEELRSPYVDADDVLDLEAWTRDSLALALELPANITCRLDCAGLCPRCGANLNDEPGHGHEPDADPRWAKLSELRFE